MRLISTNRKSQRIFHWSKEPKHLFTGIPFLFCLFLLLGIQACGDDDTMPVIETGTVTDHEGNIYKTVKIGKQWWMAENLNAKTFSTGLPIQEITEKTEWATTPTPAYCTFNNTSIGTGKLYNFHVITSDKNIAPEGWRVPSDEDWKILEEYLGMPVAELDEINWRGTLEGDQLKVKNTGSSGWVTFDGVWATNSTGFTALGSSCRVFNGDWGVPPLRQSEYWWSSTTSNGYGWFRSLDYKKSGIFRYNAEPNYGFSIRCVKN